MLKALIGSKVGDAEGVVRQGFAVAAAKVCEGRCIAIVRLLPNVDLLSAGCVCAVIEAGALAGRRVIRYDLRLGGRLFSAEQWLQADGAHAGGGRGNAAYASKELPAAFRTRCIPK